MPVAVLASSACAANRLMAAPRSRQLPQAQGSARGDLRAQPRAAAAGWRRAETRQEEAMIETRRAQRTFGDGLIAEEGKDLLEEWMQHGDRVLGDKEIVAAIYQALAKRHPQSRTRGRPGTPAEVVLRLLVLKHMRNWSYGVLEREVRANLVYRDFTRVGGAKMPDAKTMGRWGVAVGPVVVTATRTTGGQPDRVRFTPDSLV